MEFVTGRLRPVRVVYLCENTSKCPVEVSAAFEAAGARMIVDPQGADIILFGVCACCPDGLGKLGELTREIDADCNCGPTKGRGIVLFRVGDLGCRTPFYGILDHPTPEQLVAAAWEVRPPIQQWE